MKTINKILLLFFWFCLTSASTCQPMESKVVATKSTKMKYNIVGIVGEASSTPYIEVQYVKDDGYGQNVMEKKMVVPPFVFGGHLVNIRYDSIVGYFGNRAESYGLKLLRDHQVNGAEYLRIINHSEDKTIEYFIAESQDVQSYKSVCNLDLVTVLPDIMRGCQKSQKKYRRPDLKVEYLYGAVSPKKKLEGNANIWLIATPRLFEPSLGFGEL